MTGPCGCWGTGVGVFLGICVGVGVSVGAAVGVAIGVAVATVVGIGPDDCVGADPPQEARKTLMKSIVPREKNRGTRAWTSRCFFNGKYHISYLSKSISVIARKWTESVRCIPVRADFFSFVQPV